MVTSGWRVVKVLVSLFVFISCKPTSSDEAMLKIAYLGSWERIGKAEKGFTIYEQDNGLFLRYRNGETHPLTYEASGNYFYAATALGHRPILLNDGIITIHNGFTFRYKKLNK